MKIRKEPNLDAERTGTAGQKIYGSGVEKATPGGIKNTGFFVSVGEGQGVYICSPENGGNSFYIALLPTPRLIVPNQPISLRI